MRCQPIPGALGLATAILISLAMVRVEAKDIGYGSLSDVKFAERLWSALKQDRWVGSSRRMASAQRGDRPHGSVQQIAKGELVVAGRNGRVLVKANHRGTKLNPAQVMRNPDKYLSGYAVMYQREPGYDAGNRDWFWVVFERNGTVRRFQGKAIAGRVDTGSTNGCIGCHRKKGGRDLETLTRQ